MERSKRARMASVLAVAACASAIASESTVTEREAVQRFLEESPQARRVANGAAAAEAAARGHALVPNPEIAYEVEDAGGVRDEFLTVRQELPVNGSLGWLRERTEAAVSAAGFAGRRALEFDVAGLRVSFHEVLYRQAARARIEREAEQLEQLAAILARREREGEGSGYDSIRAEQALAEVTISIKATEADLAAARARFGSYFDPAVEMGSVELSPEFASNDPLPPTESAIARALALRTDLRALLAEVDRREFDRKAARRQRFPEPTLTAGWKRTGSAGLDDSGFVAGLSVALPIFNRGRPGVAHADAEAERTALDVQILRREIDAEVRSALARERAAREAVRVYGTDADRRAIELIRIARLAYDEGERGILELIDAHKTALEMDLRLLALRYEVKRAQIERNLAIGLEVQP